MRRVLCLWLPNWPIQRRRAELDPPPHAALPAAPEPKIAAKQRAAVNSTRIDQAGAVDQVPLVLVRRDPRGGQFVAACCEGAAAAGIRPGMPASFVAGCLAPATAERAKRPHHQPKIPARPAPIVAEHDPERDTAVLREIARRCLQRFSPIVALEPIASRPWAGQTLAQPQSLLLDVTGLAPLFGGELNLVAAVQTQLRQWGFTAQLALAGTVGAAWGLALVRATSVRPVLVPPGQDAAALRPLPLEALRLPGEIIETLRRLGIGTIGGLMGLPRAGLLQRFDPLLVQRLDQALGQAAEPLETEHERPPLVAQADLDCPTHDRELIGRAVCTLLEEVAKNLAALRQGALRLECSLTIQDRNPVVVELGLFAPTAEPRHLARLLDDALERRGLPGDVTRVAVRATLLGALQQWQTGLLADRSAPVASGSALAHLIDRLAGRLGRQRVLGVRMCDDHQPEWAAELFPLAGEEAGGGRCSTSRSRRSRTNAQASRSRAKASVRLGPAPQDPLRRPLELWPVPQRLELWAAAPHGPPARFRWQGVWYQTARCWGPERIETGWWRGPSVRRHYFRIETTDGNWWWLFQELTEQHWFLHGRFV